jgi:uncharacterized membrane protein
MKGSVGILILLLVIFFPAGIIYAIFMSVGNTEACPQCNSSNTIPYYSPRAKELMKEHNVKFDDIDATFLLNEKKPWYKKWWVWALGFFFFYMLMITILI